MLIRKPLVVACMALAPMVHAQESENWKGEAELGVLVTSGNSEETKVNGRLGLIHETGTWRNSGDFSSKYTEAEDETTAEEYKAALEADYKFDDQQYWFVRGSWEDDRFSGYDFESTLTTGYGSLATVPSWTCLPAPVIATTSSSRWTWTPVVTWKKKPSRGWQASSITVCLKPPCSGRN